MIKEDIELRLEKLKIFQIGYIVFCLLYTTIETITDF